MKLGLPSRTPIVRIVLSTLAAVVAVPALAAAPKDPADLTPILQPILARSKAPALAAAVYRDGHLIALGVCGVRSIDTNEPVKPDDRFPIGSCSKPMARVLIARLAEQGKLDFDAPLAQYLDGPDMKNEYRTVTLADLMAHRAGIQPYTQIGPKITPFLFELTGTPREQRATFSAHVLAEEPAAPPKTSFLYSNAGFCILAAAAEKATGQDWEALAASEVFRPLSLTTATEGGDGVLVRGHRRSPDGPRVARPYQRMPVMVPAGGVSLSIADFAAFASAEADLEAGRPAAGLTEKSLNRLPQLRPADGPPAGQGGAMTFGGDGQYHAGFATWPKQRAAIAVTCNLGDSDDLCTEIAAAVRAAITPDLEPGDTAMASGPGGPGAPNAAPGPDGPRYGYSLKVENDRIEIATVVSGSIAEKAGVKEGDIILKINGAPVASIDESKRMNQLRATPLTLTVDRAGTEVEIKLKK